MGRLDKFGHSDNDNHSSKPSRIDKWKLTVAAACLGLVGCATDGRKSDEPLPIIDPAAKSEALKGIREHKTAYVEEARQTVQKAQTELVQHRGLVENDTTGAKNVTNEAASEFGELGLSSDELEAAKKKAQDYSYSAPLERAKVEMNAKPKDRPKEKKPNYNTPLDTSLFWDWALNPTLNSINRNTTDVSSAMGNIGQVLKGILGNNVETGVRYSTQYGPILDIGIMINSADGKKILYLKGSGGPKQKSALAALGIEFREDLQGVIILQGLEQTRTFDQQGLQQTRTFDQLNKDYTVSQYGGGVALSYAPKDMGPVSALTGQLTYSKSSNTNIGQTYIVKRIPGISFDESIVDNIFNGEQFVEATGSAVFNIGEGGALTALGGGSISTPNVPTLNNNGGKSTFHEGWGLKYDQYMREYGKASLSNRESGGINTTSLSYDGHIPLDTNYNMPARVEANYITGNYKDGVIGFKLDIPLDKAPLRKSERPANGTLPPLSAAIQQVVREQEFKTVRGGVEQTNLRHLLTIDETKLPGASYLETDPKDGHLIAVNLDSGVNNLQMVNATNPADAISHFNVKEWGQFLRITNIESLIPGVEYRVSVRSTDGTYTLYSMTFAHGSVIFNTAPRIANNATAENAAAFIAGTKTFDQARTNAVDTPTVNNAPTITAKTDTSITATNNISDADGPLQTLTYMLYAADGTTLISSKTTNSWGPADGVTANTPYKVRTSAMALNLATGQSVVYLSPFTDVTTDAAPVIPDTTAPLTVTPPAISVAPTDTTASVTQMINENGTGYFLVLPATSPAPSVAEVMAGTLFQMTGGVIKQVNLSGLPENTALVYYFVAKDTAGTPPNAQSTVSSLAIRTLASSPSPVTPSAPSVTADDTANTVSGMAAGMEYNLDGAGYVAYDATTFNAINFAGNHSLLVRVAAAGINPASPDTTLSLTTNPVTPSAPSVTVDDTANTVSGMAAGMEYNLDGAGYVAYDATTFNAINFAGNHSLLVRVAAAGINPASPDTTLSLTTNPVTPSAPSVTVDDTANTVSGMAAGMEYNLDGAGYVAYNAATFNAINFAGNHSLLVRVAAAGINPAGPDTTLSLTTNPVTPSAPSVTVDDTANTVSGMAAGMEYNLDGAGYVAYDATTFNAINFAGNHSLLVRVAAAGINPASPDTTLSLTTNPDTTRPSTPTLILNGWNPFTSTTTFPIAITNDTDNIGVTGWYVSESSSIPASSSFGLEETTTTVSAGDGLKTVYVTTTDAAGNISLVGSSTITLDTVTPNASAWTLWVTAKSTAYTGRKVTLAVWPSGISPTGLSVSSANGWAITNVSVSGGVVTFDYNTGAAPGDDITISGTSGSWVSFTETISTPALN